MKLNNFDEFVVESSIVHTSIQRKFLREHVKGNWHMNPDGTTDVEGDFSLNDVRIEKLPVKFGEVSGNFHLGGCVNLKTLEGCPSYVGGRFSCNQCKSLTTLMYAPWDARSVFLYSFCIGVPKEEQEFCKDRKHREEWLKSGLNFEDYVKRNRGRLKGEKFNL